MDENIIYRSGEIVISEISRSETPPKDSVLDLLKNTIREKTSELFVTNSRFREKNLLIDIEDLIFEFKKERGIDQTNFQEEKENRNLILGSYENKTIIFK